jgi:V8-like Glu-specific endopeptidase
MKTLTLLLTISLFNYNSMAMDKTICGGVDDRTLSANPKVGRLLGWKYSGGGCTVTLIGKSCAITAGHCKKHFNIVEMNTPISKKGRIQHSAKTDIYKVDKSSIFSVYTSVIKDYAVLRLLPNKYTGRYPGEVQGFYKVDMNAPKSQKLEIRITGYGLDEDEPTRNKAQQTRTGITSQIYSKDQGPVIRYQLDSEGGDSGAAIINEKTQKVIGIHTNGGCGRTTDASINTNRGTAIFQINELKRAIKSCLDYEKRL